MLDIIKNPILCGMVVSVVLPLAILIIGEISDKLFDKKLLAIQNQNK